MPGSPSPQAPVSPLPRLAEANGPGGAAQADTIVRPAPRPSPVPPAEPPVALHPFRSDNPDDRLRDLLALGMAIDDGKPITPDTAEAFRRKAEGDLTAHAFRILHNRAEEIRREAQEEARATLRKPPGFLMLVVANLVALITAGGLAVLAARMLGGAH